MSEKIFVVPKKGVSVRRQDGQHISESGESVEDNSYYRRRIADGDLIVQKVSAKAKSKPSHSKTEV